MLSGMGPSSEALGFAVRAGQLGVTDEQGRRLAMACADDSGDLKDAAQEEDPAGADLDDEAARDAPHRVDSAEERDEQRTLARADDTCPGGC
jgi:hypothetical protein